MKAVIISIASLFLLSACVDDDDETKAVYDIECQGQENGWHEFTDTVTDSNGNYYKLEGEWHCKNEIIWYSEAQDEVNLFGRVYVDKIDTDGETTQYDYHFIQLDQAQNLVIQQNARDEDNNYYIESYDLTLKFATTDGLLPQLFTMTPFSSNTYSLEFNYNQNDIDTLSWTRFKNIDDNLYKYGTSACEATNNQDWDCENWDSYYYYDQIHEKNIYSQDTQKSKSLTPDKNKLLNNPLETRDELIRLTEKLFD
ncbi:hypothetical protein GCM10007916_22680 [Psychromonas marina]|uniref:Uncharacterized protein n=1 Tax=Psychromonas marina TaxID=88364 RepID=A0ABQ6E176_9GAMM|nr:hypothetical protein [Psychromonas marina]GLS91199.1 hypothetical protein GCM10007916_22680 [Psychromonas marina]